MAKEEGGSPASGGYLVAMRSGDEQKRKKEKERKKKKEMENVSFSFDVYLRFA